MILMKLIFFLFISDCFYEMETFSHLEIADFVYIWYK